MIRSSLLVIWLSESNFWLKQESGLNRSCPWQSSSNPIKNQSLWKQTTTTAATATTATTHRDGVNAVLAFKWFFFLCKSEKWTECIVKKTNQKRSLDYTNLGFNAIFANFVFHCFKNNCVCYSIILIFKLPYFSRKQMQTIDGTICSSVLSKTNLSKLLF